MNKKLLKRSLFALALPIAIQSLIAFFGNAIDTVMIGQVSQTAFSGTSLANQVFFIITMILSGIAGGSNVLISQYWGRRDRDSIYKVLSYTYRFALGFVCLIVFFSLFFPDTVLRIFSNDPQLIEQGSIYLRYVCLSYLFFSISTITVQVLRSVHEVKIAMISSLTALLCNACLNYLLIFGNFGFPKLGVMGAGIATTIARFIELIVVMVYVYRYEQHLQLRLHKLRALDKDVLRLFFQKCSPVCANEAMWSLGESCVVMIIGRLGPSVVMAMGIYNVIAQLSSVLMSGLNSAACVLIGNTLGAKKIGELQTLRSYFQKLSLVIGGLDGALMLLSIPIAFMIYPMDEETRNITLQILMLGAIIEFFKSFQCMNMMGILRGGGDVKFACMNDIIFLWGLALPLGFVCAVLLKLPFAIVFIAIKSDQVVKCITSELRIRKNHWMKAI